jgi:hypothetical protein
MDIYEFHPFANAFPMMTDQEHAALVADIKASGLRELITRYDGKLLDGRNRDKACRELGIEPTYVEFDGDDAAALAFVISRNLMRRQLTASQRAMVADKLTTLKLGQRKSDTSKDVSQPEAAKLANASLPGTQRARTVRTKGTPELVAAVEQGDVPVTSASEFAKQFSPAEQTEQIEQHGSPAGAVKAMKGNVKTPSSEEEALASAEFEAFTLSQYKSWRESKTPDENAKMDEHARRLRAALDQYYSARNEKFTADHCLAEITADLFGAHQALVSRYNDLVDEFNAEVKDASRKRTTVK